MNRLVFKIDPPNPARCPMCGERLIGQECTVVHDTVFCLFCDQTATPYEIEQTLFCANEPTMSDQWCTRLGLNIYCPSLYNPTAFMLPRFQLVDLDR